LVVLAASAWLAALLDGPSLTVTGAPPMGPALPLPGTLDHFDLRFQMARIELPEAEPGFPRNVGLT
jgi:hypothetical protein